MKLLNLTFVAFLMFSNLTNAADLTGWQGEFSIKYPTVNDTIGGPTSFIVGNSVEASVNAGNIDFSLDISTNEIFLGFNDGGCCTSGALFAGPVISFTNPLENITSVSLLGTNILNFTSSNISFNNNQIFINIANGFDLSNNRSINLLIATSPVPEPESYSLMIMGFGLVGLLSRRKTFTLFQSSTLQANFDS